MTQDNNRKLEDVEALLKKLQSFEEEDSTEPQDVVEESAGPSKAVIYGGVIVGIFVVAATAVGSVLFFVPQEKIQSQLSYVSGLLHLDNLSTGSTLEQSQSVLTLDEARKLIQKGKIVAAREKLSGLAEQGNPDAAFALARTYDPNVLRELPDAIKFADRTQARFWYKKWHALGQEKGVVTLSNEKLERLLTPLR